MYINDDIWYLIFKYLEFHDQVQLSCVSFNLQNIFRNIYRNVFKHVEIIKVPSSYFMVDKDTLHVLSLDLMQLNTFKTAHGKYVEHLEITIEVVERQREFHLVLGFPNLKHLSYPPIQSLQDDNLSLIVRNCPNLQTLQLCCSSESNNGYIDISHLLGFKHLKCLKYEYVSEDGHPMPKLRFEQLLELTKLETLHADKVLVSVDNGNIHDCRCYGKLKELKLVTGFFKAQWLNSPSFSGCLENLQTLQIKVATFSCEDFFATVSQICQKLQNLIIIHTRFPALKALKLPCNVKDLKLSSCDGLSLENLKQILSHQGLQKFTSENTFNECYETNVPIRIAESIQTLNMHDTVINILNPINLEELSFKEWHNGIQFPKNMSLKSLCLSDGKVPVAKGTFPSFLFELKNLTMLSLNIYDIIEYELQVLLWEVLSHFSLAEFRFTSSIPIIEYPEYSRFPKPLKTKVERLFLCHKTFGKFGSLWMDLMKDNPNIIIIYRCECHWLLSSLIRLVELSQLPLDLKTFNLWGFDIDITKFLNEPSAPECLQHNICASSSAVLSRKKIDRRLLSSLNK